MQGKLFYTYNDIYGNGINQQYLTTYNESVIFDGQNRTLYANHTVVGNHATGSYHGEIFNDFSRNIASGDYSHAEGVLTKALAYASSTHGECTVSSVRGGAAFGRFNEDNSSYIFSIGNGNANKRNNALTVSESGVVNIPGEFTVKNRNVVSYVDSSYAYLVNSYNNLRKYTTDLNSYVHDSYSYIINSYNNLHNYTTTSYNNLSSYVLGSYLYTRNSYNNLYSYTLNSYSYITDSYNNLHSYLLDSYNHTETSYNNLLEYTTTSYNNLYSYTTQSIGYVHNELGHINSHSVLTPMTSTSQLYIWRGTFNELPVAEERYSNVLYIVTEEEPTGKIYSE